VTVVDGPAGPSDEPADAVRLFGQRLPVARAYADRLAQDAVVRGLIGPREVPILWRRHIVNCALVADLLPVGAVVVDVGSGAGLPGLVLAIRRPDLRVRLVEPLLRRSTFLEESVDRLGLSAQVRVTRGRAEDPAVLDSLGESDWVVARAVAPLDRLVRWCVPLLRVGGSLLALKGERVQEEITGAAIALRQTGGVVRHSTALGDGDDRTWVVAVERTRRNTGSQERRTR